MTKVKSSVFWLLFSCVLITTAQAQPERRRSSTLFTAASPEALVRCKPLPQLKRDYPHSFVLTDDLPIGEMELCRAGVVKTVHTDGAGNPLVLPAGTIIGTKTPVSQQNQLTDGMVESIPSGTGGMLAGCGNTWRNPRHPALPPTAPPPPPSYTPPPSPTPEPARVCNSRIDLELKPLRWASVKKGIKGHIFDALFTVGISAAGGGWVGPTVALAGTVGGGMMQDARHPLVYAVTARVDDQVYPFTSPFQTVKHRDFDVELRLAQNPADTESLMAEVDFTGYPNCYRAIAIPKNRNNTWVIAFGNPFDDKKSNRAQKPRTQRQYPQTSTTINNTIINTLSQNQTQNQTQQNTQSLSNPTQLVWNSGRTTPPVRESTPVPPRPPINRGTPPARQTPHPTPTPYKAPVQRGRLP